MVKIEMTFEEFEASIAGDNNEGACRACGKIADGVEPDARKYKCVHCGEFKVYGLEDLAIMGGFQFSDGSSL